jgi:hypothetical protein
VHDANAKAVKAWYSDRRKSYISYSCVTPLQPPFVSSSKNVFYIVFRRCESPASLLSSSFMGAGFK